MHTPVYYVKNEKIPGFSGGESPEGLECLEWETLLETAYPSAALALPYCTLDESGEFVEGMPRINNGGVTFLEERGYGVFMHSVWLDVDNPGHAKWENEEQFFSALAQAEEALGPVFEDCYWYMTPSGYRLVWQLPYMLPVSQWRSFSEQFITWLREHGIEADEKAMVRWNQLYRLPRVTKKGTLIDLPRKGGVPGVLSWEPPLPLVEQVFGIVESVEVAVPEEIPEISPSQWREVRDSPYYRALRKPEPLGQPGGRHNALVSCAADLTNRGVTDTGTLYAMMLPSVLSDDSPGAPDEQELRLVVVHACRRQLAENAQNDAIRDSLLKQAKAKEQERIEKLGAQEPDFFSGGSVAGAPAELRKAFFNVNPDALARAQALPLEKRLFLEKGRSSYRYDERTGKYDGPFAAEPIAGIEDALPSFLPAMLTQKGGLRSKREIFARHAQKISHVISVMGSDVSLYDPGTETLYQGVAQIQPFKPTFHAQIDEWLRLLGGSDPDALLDWLACFPVLSHPTAALYIHGAPGVGKGMLAMGLSALFGQASPSDYGQVSGRFNRSVEDNPLVWADEYIPDEGTSRQKGGFSGKFRQMTGNSSFVIEEKYAPTRTIMGALRVLITANNMSVIRFDEQLSPEDFQAVSKRILYVRSDDASAAYLTQLGGRKVTDGWVASQIAEHVLWLMQNRPVTPGARLLVEGRPSPLHNTLQRKVGINDLLLEVIVTAIEMGQHANGLLLWGRGEVLVKPKAIHRLWEMVHGESARMPSSSTIREAFRGICWHQRKIRTPDGKQPRYYSINLHTLVAFSTSVGAFEGDEGPLMRAIDDTNVPWVLNGIYAL